MLDQIKTIPKYQLIIGCIVIFIILPLVITIFFLANQDNRPLTIEAASQSDTDELLTNTITTQGKINLNEAVLHKIGQDGQWVAVKIISTASTSYGNSSLMVLQKEGENYQIKYFGTNYGKNDFQAINVPNGLINQILDKNNIGNKYTDILVDSNKNPINKYPLLQKLPYYSDKLKINYTFQDDTPIIHIDGSNAAQRSLSISKIRNFGYDPGDYKIEFNNFINPFTGGNK